MFWSNFRITLYSSATGCEKGGAGPTCSSEARVSFADRVVEGAFRRNRRSPFFPLKYLKEKKMPLVVQKFGGSSVATLDRIRKAAARIIDSKKEDAHLVVVVSAMGDTTDELLSLASRANPDPPKREVDLLLSTGEIVSCALLSMSLNSLGAEAVAFTGLQGGIITDDVHTKARIQKIEAERILEEIHKDRIVVVAGFQGVTQKNIITTLGRGGSDLTAVALAAALKADVCEIYTDVEGVYTADPRIVPEARKLKRIFYDELLEMASSGARVMHLRAVEVAKNYGVRLHIRSSFNEKEGTIVE